MMSSCIVLRPTLFEISAYGATGGWGGQVLISPKIEPGSRDTGLFALCEYIFCTLPKFWPLQWGPPRFKND